MLRVTREEPWADAFGRVLAKVMAKRGVSSVPELVARMSEAGYNFSEKKLLTYMRGTSLERNPELLRGVVEALGFSEEDRNAPEVKRLVVAFFFNKDLEEESTQEELE